MPLENRYRGINENVGSHRKKSMTEIIAQDRLRDKERLQEIGRKIFK